MSELGEIATKLGFSKVEKARILGIYLSMIGATTAGMVVLTFVGSTSVVLAGLGVVAYILGLRHGADADHIVAIDNMTRKLIHGGKRPLSVGTWFSLGHSTVVMGLIVALILSMRAVLRYTPSLAVSGSLVGTMISGTFLWLIGLVNVVIVLEIYKQLRTGRLDSGELERQCNNRGFLNRNFSRLFKLVKKPWQMYPIGLLFGLGFDTASEVALIAISAGAGVSSRIPISMILVLPFMFTCGMILVDTTDGIAMRMAYGWALLNPIRKIYYNLTITLISVLAAFVIGSVELLGVLPVEVHLSGSFWNWLSYIDFETLGLVIVAIFTLSWIASIAIYRLKKI